MKFVPLIGSPPIPMTGGLTEASLAQLMHSLVGEGSGAGYNTPGSTGLMHRSRHDADFALAGSNDTGAVRPDQTSGLVAR